MKVSAIPKHLLNSGGPPTVDKIKKVIERLTSENNSGAKPISPLVQRRSTTTTTTTTQDDPRTRKMVFYNGPIIITDRAFTDTLVKIRNLGERFVVFCLAKSSTTPVTRVDDVYPIGTHQFFIFV